MQLSMRRTFFSYFSNYAKNFFFFYWLWEEFWLVLVLWCL